VNEHLFGYLSSRHKERQRISFNALWRMIPVRTPPGSYFKLRDEGGWFSQVCDTKIYLFRSDSLNVSDTKVGMPLSLELCLIQPEQIFRGFRVTVGRKNEAAGKQSDEGR
jgi:hypothetical protein